MYSWAQSAATQSRCASRPSSPAISVRAVRASCRLTQLRCWVVPGRDSSSSASSVRRVPSLHSSVRLRRGQTWPLFLQALRHFCSAGGPRVRSASLRSVLGKNAAKPSGQPGHGRPGRWRRHCPSSRLCSRGQAPSTKPCCQPKTARFRPHQRRCLVLLFEGQCLFAKTVVPRIKAGASLTPLGRPGPGRVGRLPTLRAGLFRCSREPVVSLPRRSRDRRPHTQDRLRGHAPLRFASLVTGRLAGDSRNQVRGNAGDISRIDLPACKTPSNQGHPGAHARTSVRHRPASPARRPEKGYKYILKEAAADAAAGADNLA